jgi:hypothetical protein
MMESPAASGRQLENNRGNVGIRGCMGIGRRRARKFRRCLVGARFSPPPPSPTIPPPRLNVSRSFHVCVPIILLYTAVFQLSA